MNNKEVVLMLKLFIENKIKEIWILMFDIIK